MMKLAIYLATLCVLMCLVQCSAHRRRWGIGWGRQNNQAPPKNPRKQQQANAGSIHDFQDSKCCEDGWSPAPNEQKCYWAETTPRSKEEAISFCAAKGGRLWEPECTRNDAAESESSRSDEEEIPATNENNKATDKTSQSGTNDRHTNETETTDVDNIATNASTEFEDGSKQGNTYESGSRNETSVNLEVVTYLIKAFGFEKELDTDKGDIFKVILDDTQKEQIYAKVKQAVIQALGDALGDPKRFRRSVRRNKKSPKNKEPKQHEDKCVIELEIAGENVTFTLESCNQTINFTCERGMKANGAKTETENKQREQGLWQGKFPGKQSKGSWNKESANSEEENFSGKGNSGRGRGKGKKGKGKALSKGGKGRKRG